MTQSLAIAEERTITKSSLSQSKLDEFDEAYQSAVQNINAYVKDPLKNAQALNIARFKLNVAMNQVQGEGYEKLRTALQGLLKKVDEFEADRPKSPDEEPEPEGGATK